MRPPPLAVGAHERVRATVGALLGILVTALATHLLADAFGLPGWIVAPIGASAVIVFALPSSPLARPWSVIAGNGVSALVGVVVVQLAPEPHLAASLAVGGAIAAMMLARCLHPPGAAVALLTVLSQVGEVHAALTPVIVNSTFIVLSASIYNAVTRRPHAVAPPPQQAAQAPPARRFTAADLDAALAHREELVDVSREELETLLYEAESIAWQRTLGALRCGDIMSRAPITVGESDELSRAWRLLHAHSVKALPVVDGEGRMSGIVTLADLVRRIQLQADGQDDEHGLSGDLSDRVDGVMTRQVRHATDTMRVIELLPLFSEGGHHHLPVVDADGRLVGVITQSDLVRALHGALG